MARGHKPGPFRALEIRKSPDGKLAAAVAPCPVCETERSLIVDAKGWLSLDCPVRDGCGFNQYARNQKGAQYLIRRATRWATPENLKRALDLCAGISLYPKAGHKPFEAEKISEPEPMQETAEPESEKKAKKPSKKKKADKAKKENKAEETALEEEELFCE